MPQLHVLMPLPSYGYECTEASVPWKVLTDSGIDVTIATPDGEPAKPDASTATGEGLGFLGKLFKATKPSFEAYREMCSSNTYASPITWEDIDVGRFDAIVLPGGHHQEMRPYLGSELLQAKVAEFAAQEKKIAAICHGVLLAARSQDATGQSILSGRKVTTVPTEAENQVNKLCAKRMGHKRFGKPYDLTAEEEIRELMGGKGELVIVKMPFRKDGPGKDDRGLCFVDGPFVTARMPHDAWTFSKMALRHISGVGA